jgi:hypothetical protein
MKADAEWAALERKLAHAEVGWERVTVTPLLATLPYARGDGLCERVRERMADLSAQIPCVATGGDDGSSNAERGEGASELVVGSLDLNIGRTLPAEELVGRLPQARRSCRISGGAATTCTELV